MESADNLINNDRVIVREVVPGYWLVSLANPPLNLFDPEVFAGLNLLKTKVEAESEVKVVVFESVVPDYFIAHLNISRLKELPAIDGALPIVEQWPHFSHWLSTAPVVTIAKIRGRARGIGNEFLSALDMRFASRENAVFAQLELAFGMTPGGGGLEWLPKHLGRGRALEMILGAQDLNAEEAERYGLINKAIPDALLDAHVDQLARRIASFSKRAITVTKQLIGRRYEVPSTAQLKESFDAILKLAGSPESMEAVKAIRQKGWNTPETELVMP